ncbi:N-acetylmuramic acid 6-phosphate etherase [Glaciecola sp. MH2013]|uniref:N-acetylmuramic acid 6-phosphate etherase n=1 Tax=Glaciecola sp. MH2013 TaxID=2785524 RepID=UPI001E62784B|nr:N-acetylmuramic acid 6-phosphate etherase [Glaciecola sp. MH2013]
MPKYAKTPIDKAQIAAVTPNKLGAIGTETRNNLSNNIDLMTTEEMLRLINSEDAKVALAVEKAIPDITNTVDLAVTSLQINARVIYVGAGTSGRLGILDAVECRPTFSVDDNIFVGLLAGGEKALIHAVEGAEDNAQAGANDLASINLCEDDLVIGLAASGRTPYVIGAIDYANSLGCNTACIICSPNGELLKHAKVGIVADVGAEVLTGSTRMKSGTAQKLILNMISTASMIKMGKSFGNLMVDVNATNDKLVARAQSIVMQATDCDVTLAKQVLLKSDNNAKLAILSILTDSDIDTCKNLLKQENGFLRQALAQVKLRR